jgi:hypothetical protein
MFVDEESRIMPKQRIEIELDKCLLVSPILYDKPQGGFITSIINLNTSQLMILNLQLVLSRNYTSIETFIKNYNYDVNLILKHIAKQLEEKTLSLEFLKNIKSTNNPNAYKLMA